MVEMTTYAPGIPTWVDVSTPDMEATKAFYGRLFGWEATSYPEMGGYTRFTMNGKLICGAVPFMSPDQQAAWSTYISVSDADATTQAVQKHGGHVAVEPMDVADLGRMAMFIDPTGALFGIWQPGQFNGAQIVNEPGAFCWNELETRDMDAAKAFYTAVFPWTAETTGEGADAHTLWNVDGRSIAGSHVLDEPSPPNPSPNWQTFFAVADSDATTAKAKELGGTIVMPGMDTPFGRIAVITDPHGTVLATIQLTQ